MAYVILHLTSRIIFRLASVGTYRSGMCTHKFDIQVDLQVEVQAYIPVVDIHNHPRPLRVLTVVPLSYPKESTSTNPHSLTQPKTNNTPAQPARISDALECPARRWHTTTPPPVPLLALRHLCHATKGHPGVPGLRAAACLRAACQPAISLAKTLADDSFRDWQRHADSSHWQRHADADTDTDTDTDRQTHADAGADAAGWSEVFSGDAHRIRAGRQRGAIDTSTGHALAVGCFAGPVVTSIITVNQYCYSCYFTRFPCPSRLNQAGSSIACICCMCVLHYRRPRHLFQSGLGVEEQSEVSFLLLLLLLLLLPVSVSLACC